MLNLETAKAAVAESSEYFREAVTQPLGFALFRPELADVITEHFAAYANSLQEILFGANGEFTGELQRQLAAMTGQDPFQWCLMGRDFLPDHGSTLPNMSVADDGVGRGLPARRQAAACSNGRSRAAQNAAAGAAPADAKPGAAAE
ncbi:hypothetical protein ACU4GD_10355 [Cupriavidus basilensis]